MIRKICVLAPTLIGIILLAVVSHNARQLIQNDISVSTIMSRETPLVLLGLFFSGVALCLCVASLFGRKWLDAVAAFASILAFFVLFTWGGAMGASYFYAT